MKMPKVDLSTIPSVDTILQSPAANTLINIAGRELAIKAIRQSLDQIREKMRSGLPLPNVTVIIKEANKFAIEWVQPSLYPVINASGIILHTNLGRSPLSDDTIKAMQTVNAAAVLLVLTALAKHKKVIIPNSQLVEIGGGFRVPDVMRQSGAKLIPIGTTNRIHLSDYVQALEDGTSLVLNAHHSNFKIIGFTTEPKLEEVVAATHKHSVPFVYDLGSGAMMDTSSYGLAHEPTVTEAISAGADIICFSGDKLLGGPQAGIILGRSDLVKKIKRHPLARAVRADKTCLSGISATLIHYLKGEAEKIPIWKMIALDKGTIHQRALGWQKSIRQGNVIDGYSMVGGGSLPGETLPTYLLALDIPKANKFLACLRALPFPIIARIENGQALFDPRTVLPTQEKAFLLGLKQVLLNQE
jgi:L-seryl-tRNA(Ser) seleniumtransferase